MIIALGLVFYYSIDRQEYEEASVTENKYQQQIIATGSIKSREDASLSFKETGTVTQIFLQPGDKVRKGQIIIQLDESELIAGINEQISQVVRANAQLDITRGQLSPEQQARINANVFAAKSNAQGASRIALARLQSSAAEIEGFVRKTIDVYFNDPRSGHPEVRLINLSFEKGKQINNGREEIESIFVSWSPWLHTGKVADVSSVSKSFAQDLRRIDEIFFRAFTILDSGVGGDDESIAALLEGRRIVLNALEEITQDLNNILSTRAEYEKAVSIAEEERSGGSESEVFAQQAQVSSEQERLRKAQIQLAQSRIISPFDGVIGEILVSIGESVQTGSAAARVISEGGFSFEADITELEVQELNIGQQLSARVDALDEEITIQVRTIDATAKTQQEVPVYNVVFDVQAGSANIKSGFSADVFIPFGDERTIVSIPRKALMSNKNGSFVLIKKGNKSKEISVERGVSIPDTDLIEVIGSIGVGDTVLIPKKQ